MNGAAAKTQFLTESPIQVPTFEAASQGFQQLGVAQPPQLVKSGYGRGETIYDPWHYVPVLARKPGALRNGAPFKDWVLPAALERVRRKLAGSDDGDRQMVAILAAVLTDGLPAVEAACAQA